MTLVVLLIAAPFIGSFLCVLIRRLPRGETVAMARSACESCGARLRPWELIPIVSYALQRGRCRHCGARIAPMHLWVEVCAFLPPLMAAASGIEGLGALAAASGLGWALLTLGWIDAETFLLPDVLTLPLVVAGLAQAWWLAPAALTDRALGACVGYMALVALAWVYRRLRRREGLGGGDAKLLAAGGAWVGVLALPEVLLVAALAGLGWAVLLMTRGRRITAASRIPFGPFLAAAIWVVFLTV